MSPRDAVERALGTPGRAVARLGSAGTSVTFRIGDAAEKSFTLLLDRQPPEVADGTEPAEITIELSDGQARAFASGELVLPNGVLTGEVTYRGPVRKYLPYDPILRALIQRVHRNLR